MIKSVITMSFENFHIKTGNDLRNLINVLGLTNTKAADILDIKREALSQQISRDELTPGSRVKFEDIFKKYIDANKSELHQMDVLQYVFRKSTSTTTVVYE